MFRNRGELPLVSCVEFQNEVFTHREARGYEPASVLLERNAGEGAAETNGKSQIPKRKNYAVRKHINPPEAVSTMDTMDEANSNKGILLIGHGSRDTAGVEEFRKVTADLARLVQPRPVEPCFLELAEPTIAQGVVNLVSRGVRRFTAVPLLLFAARHAKRDIPAALRQAVLQEEVLREATLHPSGNNRELQYVQADPLGCHGRILQLSQDRFDEATATIADYHCKDTTLVMIGRGSCDQGAIEQMHRFAQLRAISSGVAETLVGFVAMAQPSVETVLAAVAKSRPKQVIVQPHLLFPGLLYNQISQEVEEYQNKMSGVSWMATPPLGATVQLAEALVEMEQSTRKQADWEKS